MTPDKTMKDFVSEAKSKIEEVEVADVGDYLADGYQVLDVREPYEFSKGSIAGAFNVPRGVLEGAADHEVKGREELQDRDKKLLVFCVSSARSAMATLVLQQMGFKHVKNINGGIKAWKKANLPIELNTKEE